MSSLEKLCHIRTKNKTRCEDRRRRGESCHRLMCHNKMFFIFSCHNKTGCVVWFHVLSWLENMTWHHDEHHMASSEEQFHTRCSWWREEKKKCIQQLPECCTSASVSFQETFGFLPIQMQSLSEVPRYMLFTKLAFKMWSCCPITATGGVSKPRDVREMGR